MHAKRIGQQMTTKRSLGSLIVVAAVVMPASVMATNGYFLIGFGAQQRGMGGAATAATHDGLAASVNAAAMVDIEDRFDIGADLFLPKAAAFVDSTELPANHESERDTFLIPNMGAVYKWSDDITIGFAVVGAGAATRYTQAVAECQDADPLTVGNNFFNFSCNASTPFGDNNRLSIDLYQMQMLPSIAYKLNEQHSVGASVVIAFQQFRAFGFGAMEALGFTDSQGAITNNGWDRSLGYGLRANWLGKFMGDRLKIGVNYSPRVNMEEFDKYKGLFAEQGDFDIPENFALGLAYQLDDKVGIAFDIHRINFGDVKSVGNPGPQASGGFFPCGSASCGALGKDEGLGFGWDNQTVYKLGAEYAHNDQWTYRAGINYGKSTIQSEDVLFNTMAPAVVELHFTAGATWYFASDMELSFSYVHAKENTVTGATAYSNRPLGTDNAAISMVQDSFGGSLGIKF